MGSLNEAKPKKTLSNSNLLFLIAAVIFVLMYLFAIISYPESFLQFQTFFDLFNLNAPLIIMTLGLCLVMIGGGIDISIGSVCGLVTMVCAVLLESGIGSVGGALLLALAIGIAFGILQGYLIAYLKIQPFIITLSGLFLAKGLLTTIHKDPINVTMSAFVSLRDYKITIPWLGTVNRLGNFIPCEIKPGVIVVVVLVVLLAALMKWSRFGRNVYAIGGNSQSALMLGINVKRTIFFTYVICGLTAGIAGFVFLMTTGAGNVGNAALFELKAIASNIIGGTLLNGGVGNLLGSPIGTLTLLIINELIRASGVQSNFQAIVSGLLLYVFIVLQSVVMSLRGRTKFRIALPPWLRPPRLPGKKKAENQG
ncbi:MAG: sugar ABC transporter permease YjfF [Spirochaetales bacterium]|nr:sugar ABC transporter permease YjfF [Spirochaetales bacterium]